MLFLAFENYIPLNTWNDLKMGRVFFIILSFRFWMLFIIFILENGKSFSENYFLFLQGNMPFVVFSIWKPYTLQHME